MSVTLLLAAALLTAPEWKRRPISASDYPEIAFKNNKSGAATVEVLINPEGRVIRCTFLEYVGDKSATSTLCDVLSSKELRPAKTSDGVATYGLRREFVKFYMPELKSGQAIEERERSVDLDLGTPPVAAITRSSRVVDVAAAVDASGKVTSCAYKASRNSENLQRLACAEVMQMPPEPKLDENGQPISYVRAVDVRFTVKR